MMDALLHNLDALALQLAQREYQREGIEMFLALEDLQQTETVALPVIDLSGQQLAARVEEVAQQRLSQQQDDPVRALRSALEMVATD